MYFYWFSNFIWFDKVFFSDFDFGAKIWDILYDEEKTYYLCLGEDIAFTESYIDKKFALANCKILYKSILSEKSVNFLNWMVYYRYSSYKSVLKYFILEDIDFLMSKEIKTKKSDLKISTDREIFEKNWLSASLLWQTLIVFPDLFNLFQTIPKDLLDQDGVILLASNDSLAQKTKKRWQVKSGKAKVIFATHSEVFQDYQDLKKIVWFDPNKWYYNNQQDPRYKIKEVLNYLSSLWWISVEIDWV